MKIHKWKLALAFLCLAVIAVFTTAALFAQGAVTTPPPPFPGDSDPANWILGLATTHPWIGTLLLIMGLLRLVIKPFMALIENSVANDPVKSKALADFEGGPIFKTLAFLLDYGASIKLKPLSASTASPNGTPLMLGMAAACGLLLLTSGCTSVAIEHGNIVTLTERTFGVTVAESASTSTPAVKLGFNSLTVQFTPTSTNGPIYAPNYANTFKIGQSAVPFSFDVDETIASGDYQTGNGTNMSSVPVVPK